MPDRDSIYTTSPHEHAILTHDGAQTQHYGQPEPLMVFRQDGTLILRDDVADALRNIVREMVREELRAQTNGAVAGQLRQFVAGL